MFSFLIFYEIEYLNKDIKYNQLILLYTNIFNFSLQSNQFQRLL
jgi:hypothetical protein